MSAATAHYRTCHLCEAMCGVEISVSPDGAINRIAGDPRDPFSRGHICPKAVALQDLHTDPDRLREPVRRVGAGWEPMSWEAALDFAAEGLRRVQDQHGTDAVGVYLGNPTVHNYSAALYAIYMQRALKTRNRYSATSADQLPHHFAAYFMLGHQLLLPIPDIDRTDFLLILGGNPAASNGSMMSAGDIRGRLKAIQSRGGQTVLLDPRRTETAALCTAHHFVRPGADVFVLAAMLNVILGEGLANPGRLADALKGADALEGAVAPFTPEAVAPVTGIDAGTLRDLARGFAAAPSAVCYGRMGASTQAFGASCQWLIIALNTVTGNLDRPGGAMLTRPAVDIVKGIGGLSKPGSWGRWKSRVRGRPEFAGELPVSVLAEEILTEGDGQIRAMITFAGNPVLSVPGGSQLERAFAKLDFQVAIDMYVNATSRTADVILPPTSPLERDHYDLVFNALAVRNTARWSPPLFTPPAGALHDWQILAGLEARLARDRTLGARLQRAARHRMGPQRILDLALRSGPHGAGWRLWQDGMSLAHLKAHPHGLDLGPLEPCLPDRLWTQDGKLDLAPSVFLDDVPRMAARMAAGPPTAPLLIGRRHLRSNNSWLHNSARLMKGKPRCTLLVHSADAARLGLKDGGTARVVSEAGSLEIPVEISDEVMPGVVSMPHGWGHGRQGVQLRVATRTPGVNMNALTDPTVLDELSGNAVLNGVPVQLSPAHP